MPSKLPAAGRQFHDLLKRLVQVPKAELDEQERLYLQQRQRLKKRGEAKKRQGRKSV